MDGFHVGKCRQHHLDFGWFEYARIMAHIAVIDLDIRLSEKAENLREQVALGIGNRVVPILDVIGQRHFFRQPVNLLLGQPRLIGPRITERLVDRVFRQKINYFIVRHIVTSRKISVC